MNSKDCQRCSGEGRIANSDDGEPWSMWASLPPGADAAVRAGLVKPIPCPSCNGTGQCLLTPEDSQRLMTR